MTDPNRNALWARALVEELVRAGVRDFCIAPGSRSTPLVLAAHEASSGESDVRCRVFLDERSAAFFALGLGKATGVPAAVITTSGTAVANLLPAVVEAHQADAPLLLLTADRPHHLRDADANQAIRQPGIFGSYTRAEWDLPQPTADVPALRHLRGVGVRAVAAAVGDPAGPVHLNVPMRKPLEPVTVAGDVPDELVELDPVALHGRDQDGDSRPLVRVTRRSSRLPEHLMEEVAEAVGAAERPVLVVGPVSRPHEVGPAAVRLAAAAGMPLLADPLSGARTGPDHGCTRIAAYDLFLRDSEVVDQLAPDLIVRVGQAPTSASLQRWLEAHGGARQIVIDGGGRWKDYQNLAWDYLQADEAATMDTLALSLPGRAGAEWRDRWSGADDAALTAALDAPGPQHEGHLAARLVRELPADRALFVSSSMPIRDVDGFGGERQEEIPIYGNRGASGIDGIISTAAGVAAGTGDHVVALVGDLAFLHDANGLLAAREGDVEFTLVVVNNDGGGIFHMLPIREHDPPFTRMFATPHGLDLSHLAHLHGIPFTRVEGVEAGVEALEEVLAETGSRILEIRTDREANRVGHEAAMAASGAAARRVLTAFSSPEG